METLKSIREQFPVVLLRFTPVFDLLSGAKRL